MEDWMMSQEITRILNQHSFTVLFSGGKDSTAALLWVMDNVNHDDWDILYIEIKGNTHPLCTQYVYDVAARLRADDRLKHVKTLDFFELMDKWGPPLLFAYRWCLYHLKCKNIEKHARFITVDGIKKSDSNARSKIYKPITFIKISKKLTISPLLDWTTNDVMSYIRRKGLPLNQCYRLFGHSGNCVFCPYASKKHIISTMADPEWGPKIRSVLLRHREKMMRGRIGREIFEKWMRWDGQTRLHTDDFRPFAST